MAPYLDRFKSIWKPDGPVTSKDQTLITHKTFIFCSHCVFVNLNLSSWTLLCAIFCVFTSVPGVCVCMCSDSEMEIEAEHYTNGVIEGSSARIMNGTYKHEEILQPDDNSIGNGVTGTCRNSTHSHTHTQAHTHRQMGMIVHATYTYIHLHRLYMLLLETYKQYQTLFFLMLHFYIFCCLLLFCLFPHIFFTLSLQHDVCTLTTCARVFVASRWGL